MGYILICVFYGFLLLILKFVFMFGVLNGVYFVVF